MRDTNTSWRIGDTYNPFISMLVIEYALTQNY